jgi:hypothetical protein
LIGGFLALCIFVVVAMLVFRNQAGEAIAALRDPGTRGSAIMRRVVFTLWLVLLLAAAAGVIAYAWEAGDLGQQCGYREGSGLHPTWPEKKAHILLVAAPAVLTAVSALVERRRALGVIGFVVLAAALAFVAVFGADIYFGAIHHCFD